jgi:hypothetical protein
VKTTATNRERLKECTKYYDGLTWERLESAADYIDRFNKLDEQERVFAVLDFARTMLRADRTGARLRMINIVASDSEFHLADKGKLEWMLGRELPTE